MTDNALSLPAHARLLAALRLNRQDEAQALLDSGADPRRPFEGGLTPLMVAARLGFAECVKILLPLSDLGARDLGGRTALALAAGGNAEADVVRLLAKARPEIAFERDGVGALPIGRAAAFGKSDCAMEILAAAGGDAPMALEGAAAARANGWAALARDLEMAAELAQLEASAKSAREEGTSRL